MAVKNFYGGVEPGHFKHTFDIPIHRITQPEKVYIPMEQHIGAPCEPVVEKGDKIKVGQKIGESESFVSAPVHASVSGEVTEIAPHFTPLGKEVKTVVIESDGLDEVAYSPPTQISNIEDLSSDEIIKQVQQAGIVGMGGAAFPTHVKISPPEDKPIDTVIINGAECEPFLTADHRIMIEMGEEVIKGLKAIMRAVSCHKGIIALEDNKDEAIENMKHLTEQEDELEVQVFETRYPQGAEKMLIQSVTGREVPSGGLPMDVGCIVNNTGTAVAIAQAIEENKPCYERVVTVTGPGIKNPGNYMVRLGTLASDLIKQCGGKTEDTKKIIVGGPMTGASQPHENFPVIKGTSGILLFTDQEVKQFEEKPCIVCGRCADVCPVKLLPTTIVQFTKKNRIDDAETYNALDCIECGACAYICPSRIPLVHHIRLAKNEIMARQKK